MSSFFGVKHTTLRIVSLMVLRPVTMTIYDLSIMLDSSRATLAPCLDEARHLNLIKSFRKPGDRKEYFELAIGKETGWEWGQWRTMRRKRMLVDPAIDLCYEILSHRAELPDSVVEQLTGIRDNLICEGNLNRKIAELKPLVYRDWLRFICGNDLTPY